jgi:hypothetical protein
MICTPNQIYSSPHTQKKTGTVSINATLRRIRVTIFAVKKQQVLHIKTICSFRYLPYSAHAL